MISQSLAKRVFPEGNAVGQRVSADFETPLQIVGVTGDVRQLGMTSEQTSEVYVPFAQHPFPLLCVAIRTEGNPINWARDVERQVWALDKNQAVSFMVPLLALASESIATQRVSGVLLAVFASLALLMAVVGIYAVVSFGVAQRTKEIGLRLALGAERRDVLRLIASQAVTPVVLGLASGTAATLALVRLLSGFLYGVSPLDPSVFTAVALLLAVCAALATYIPARHAARVDPMIAMRHE